MSQCDNEVTTTCNQQQFTCPAKVSVQVVNSIYLTQTQQGKYCKYIWVWRDPLIGYFRPLFDAKLTDRRLDKRKLTTIISEGSSTRHSFCRRANPPALLPKLKIIRFNFIIKLH